MVQKINKNIIILLLTILLIVCSIIKFDKSIIQNKEINSSLILNKVSKVCELCTTTYNYSNILSFKENRKIQQIEIPFTQKSFLIKYEGCIKAGVDIKSIKIIKNTNYELKIKLKKCKIINHTIDEKNMYVYNEKTSLFNKLTISDIFNEIANEKQKTEQELIQNGFLKKGDKNTKIILEKFLKNLGYKKIEIIYE